MITGLYAALCALLILALSFRIAGLRRRLKVGIGDGGDAGLARAIRAQANAVEYVPLMLVMLLVAENNGAGVVWFGKDHTEYQAERHRWSDAERLLPIHVLEIKAVIPIKFKLKS